MGFRGRGANRGGRINYKTRRNANVQVNVSENLREMVLRFLQSAQQVEDGIELSHFRKKFEIFHNFPFDALKLGGVSSDVPLSVLLKNIKGVKLVTKPDKQANPWLYRVPSYWSEFGFQRVDGVVEEWCSETGMGAIKIVHYEKVMGHALLDRSVGKIFVHHTNLHTLGGYRELTVGEEVECGVGTTREGFITAVAVTRRGDASSQCLNKGKYLPLHRIAPQDMWASEGPCLENGYTTTSPDRGSELRNCQEGPEWVKQLMSREEKIRADGVRVLLDILVKADPMKRRVPIGDTAKRNPNIRFVHRPVPYHAEFARIVFQTSPWMLKPLVGFLQRKSNVRYMVLDIITRLVLPPSDEESCTSGIMTESINGLPHGLPGVIAIPDTVAVLAKLLSENMNDMMYLKILRLVVFVCNIRLECKQKARICAADYIANRSQCTMSPVVLRKSLEALQCICSTSPSEPQLPVGLSQQTANWVKILNQMQSHLTSKDANVLGNVFHILTSFSYTWRLGLPVVSVVLEPTSYKIILQAIDYPPKICKYNLSELGIQLLSALLIPQASLKTDNLEVGAFSVVRSMLLNGQNHRHRQIACIVLEKAVSWEGALQVFPVIEAVMKTKIFLMLQGFAALDGHRGVAKAAENAVMAILRRVPQDHQIREQIDVWDIPFKSAKPLDVPQNNIQGGQVIDGKMIKRDGRTMDSSTSTNILDALPLLVKQEVHRMPVHTNGDGDDDADEDEVDYLDAQIMIAEPGLVQTTGTVSSSRVKDEEEESPSSPTKAMDLPERLRAPETEGFRLFQKLSRLYWTNQHFELTHTRNGYWDVLKLKTSLQKKTYEIQSALAKLKRLEPRSDFSDYHMPGYGYDAKRITTRLAMLEDRTTRRMGDYSFSQAILVVGDFNLQFSKALSAGLRHPKPEGNLIDERPPAFIVATSRQTTAELITNNHEVICQIWPLRNALGGIALAIDLDNVSECLKNAACGNSLRLLGSTTHLRSTLAEAQPCFNRVVLQFPPLPVLIDPNTLTNFFRSVRPLLLKDAEVHVHVGINPAELPAIMSPLTERARALREGAQKAGFCLVSRARFFDYLEYPLPKIPNTTYEPTTYTFLPK